MEKKKWGNGPEGEEIYRYTISNASGSYFVTMNYGANLLELHVPDRKGHLDDVVLGFQDLDSYFVNDPCFGCLVAPYANRIGNAAFTLAGETYHLDPNDNGHNNLHSGYHGLQHKMWEVTAYSEHSITYTIQKEHMECGFPGNVLISVTYCLTDDNTLSLHYHATSDRDTVFNPTNHSYFNLDGQDSGLATDALIQLDADYFTPTDEELIPHGEIEKVEGTPLDFRKPRRLGQDLTNYDYEPIRISHGYDHNFVLKTKRDSLSPVGYMASEKSGRKMEIWTDLPGIQIYSGNYVKDCPTGKNGVTYEPFSGVAFETQFFPNAVNIPSFVQPILRAGIAFDSTTEYHFTTF